MFDTVDFITEDPWRMEEVTYVTGMPIPRVGEYVSVGRISGLVTKVEYLFDAKVIAVKVA